MKKERGTSKNPKAGLEKEGELIKWFSELNKDSVSVAGGKGASLAEMYNAKVPVPAGFVVTAQAYEYFLSKTGIDEEIKKITSGLDVNNTESLNEASKKIREAIEKGEFPKDLEEEIVEAYDILDADEGGKEALDVLKNKGEPFVAVRSSATAEDLAEASFAGQQESFLNVRGHDELLFKVKKCMSSLYTPRATFYRENKGFKHEETFLAVVIQKMVNSKKSGVMFSKNPTGADDNIIIEAVWGLGEGIVSGKIKPDHYVVDCDLENFKIISSEVSDKKIAIIRNEEGHDEIVKLDEDTTKAQVLDSYQVKRLAQYGKQLEEHYGKPQDIEFAIEGKEIYIVQSRPVTTIKKSGGKSSGGELKGEVVLSGFGASPGIGSGVVKIVHSVKDLEKVKEGDVMVTEMTDPDMVVAMKRAAAIVTDEGGTTSHAAIVSREMGIPCVVGTDEATKRLKDGDVVSVDGRSGKVVMGKTENKKIEVEPIVSTKTKIKVIADLPDGAVRAAKSKSKSIGLTRLEGIIAIGGKHPLGFVKDKEMDKYVELITENLKKIVENFEEIWVRSSDIRSDEYSNLKGAPQEKEANPMMGNHGIRFSLKHRDILKAEFQAVKNVAEHFKDKKVGLMIPLLIRVEELKETKKIAEEVGLGENIKIGVMVETPAAVQIIEDLCEEGIDFISFGTNDLTQFTLAVDRNNEEVQDIYDETNPAVVRSIKHVIKICKKYGVETSICGQAGSKPAMAKILVESGIDSISVNADAAKAISELVAKIESGSEGVAKEGKGSDNTEISVARSVKGKAIENKVEETKFNVGDEDDDMDELALKALGEEDYVSGDLNKRGDVPVLNDAIPVGSDDLNSEGNDDVEISASDSDESHGEVNIGVDERELREEGGMPNVEEYMKAEALEVQEREGEIEQNLEEEVQAGIVGEGSDDLVDVLDDSEIKEDLDIFDVGEKKHHKEWKGERRR